jgi:type IV pilus assembly protein PilM
MLKTSKTFLALDFGAGTIKSAEFEVSEAGTLVLRQFGVKALGADALQDATREAAVVRAIKEMVAERGFLAKEANICATGSSVFSKFVKLPPVDTSKVTQIIQYEAQQNVPFPLEEVVWDFQILGNAPSGELEVLLVAIKADIVEGLFRTALNSGLRLQLVDVSSAALCNAFRYNYGDLDGCTMLLDIGAKSSNLLFFEKGKFYSRSINIGANAISQEFANESKVSFDDAERIKAEKGFVSLGGAYEEPDDPQAAAISKIARQVMTRLHIQVNQTIQFYRGQQGGSQPERLFLAGGASIMPYTAQFFADKLNLPVEYFNPFRAVQLGPDVAVADLEKVAHTFGEAVGLGLRNLAHCPVELNLMPKSSIKKQQFGQRRPFLIAAVFCLVLVFFAYGLFYSKLAGVKARALSDFQNEIAPMRALDVQMKQAAAARAKIAAEADQFRKWMDARQAWPRLLTELRRAALQTEAVMRKPKVHPGVWIETMTVTSDAPPPQSAATPDENSEPSADSSDDPNMAAQQQQQSLLGRFNVASLGPATNEIVYLKLGCRAINLNHVSPSYNTETAFAFARELAMKDLQYRELEKQTQSPDLTDEQKAEIARQLAAQLPGILFDAEGTQLTDAMAPAGNDTLTFTFGVTLKLKHPIRY